MSGKRGSSFTTPLLSKRLAAEKDGLPYPADSFRQPTIQVRINDIGLLHQVVQIGSSVNHISELTVYNGEITFKGMDPSQLSCYIAKIAVETPDFPPTASGFHGPIFVDLTLVEPGLNIKLYEKLNHSFNQDAFLLLRIRPNERISLSMAGFSDQRIPYSGRHRIMLLDSSPVCVAIDALVYIYTVKFPVSDLKAILNQLFQMKFSEIEFSIYNSVSGQHSALRIFAKSLRNECEHNFFSYGPPESEMCFSGESMASSEPGGPNCPEQMDIGDMRLVLCQTFLLTNINNVIKPMRDHTVRFSFEKEQPVCIRSDFNSNSQFQYFLSFVCPDGDTPGSESMPSIPESSSVVE